eukprot:jgi/Mesvir1/6651/Mv10252-RA.2
MSPTPVTRPRQFLLPAQQLLTMSRLPRERLEGVIRRWEEQQEDSFQFDSSRLRSLSESVLLSLPAWQVAPLIREPGRFVISDAAIYFQPRHNLVGATPVRSYPLTGVSAVVRRRHSLRHIGLEIFFSPTSAAPGSQGSSYRGYGPGSGRGGKGGWGDAVSSVFLVFRDNKERERVITSLLEQRELGRGLGAVGSSGSQGASGAVAGSLLESHGTWLQRVCVAWQHGAVSNLDYLLYLNLVAGRTFNDLTQYPVMPWVLADYTSATLDLTKPGTFRDLSKPVGALNPARLALYKKRFEQMPRGPDAMPPFLYGTHYSSPGYVLYWLVRSAPGHMLRLQNGKFDAPDRLFASVAESWVSANENAADVKELIPQFFLPDASFLRNWASLDLGVRQNGEAIGDVKLPPWASSAEDFIVKHCEALESEYVSRQLHQWVDLVFGYKQRGEAALAADNVFFHLTYEGAVDLDAVADPVERQALEAQINEFGQMPIQLFHTPHPPRLACKPARSASSSPPGVPGPYGLQPGGLAMDGLGMQGGAKPAAIAWPGEQGAEGVRDVFSGAVPQNLLTNILAAALGPEEVASQPQEGPSHAIAQELVTSPEHPNQSTPAPATQNGADGQCEDVAWARVDERLKVAQGEPEPRALSHPHDSISTANAAVREETESREEREGREARGADASLDEARRGGSNAGPPDGGVPARDDGFWVPTRRRHGSWPPGLHKRLASAASNMSAPGVTDTSASAQDVGGAGTQARGGGGMRPGTDLVGGVGTQGGGGRSLRLHRGAVNAVRLCTAAEAAAPTLFSCGQDGFVKISSLPDGRSTRSVQLGSLPLSAMELLAPPPGLEYRSVRHPVVLAASYDGSVYAYSVDHARVLGQTRASDDAVSCMCLATGRFSSSTQLATRGGSGCGALVTGSWDGTLKLWDLEDGRAFWGGAEGGRGVGVGAGSAWAGFRDGALPGGHLLGDHTDGISSVDCVSEGGGHAMVVGGGRDGAVLAWDARCPGGPDSQVWSTELPPGAEVTDVCFLGPGTGQGARVLVASTDGMLRVFGVGESGAELAGTHFGAGAVRCCETDGGMALAGLQDGRVGVWSIWRDLQGGRAGTGLWRDDASTAGSEDPLEAGLEHTLPIMENCPITSMCMVFGPRSSYGNLASGARCTSDTVAIGGDDSLVKIFSLPS